MEICFGTMYCTRLRGVKVLYWFYFFCNIYLNSFSFHMKSLKKGDENMPPSTCVLPLLLPRKRIIRCSMCTIDLMIL